ncbi:DUF2126 domain-containing protein [Magnetofaba australis]|uniref:Putative transglutaminase n=1 Tax=Magnetofaba australis IT-1 TaxID=1434232 RepID=A0A1Y2K1Z0_9PROT|nr:transglutaminase family protein [Magnetofaba australis]OSM02023.1 putative transglutaminase [Magnetofaba australis IT-1]
MSIDVAIRHNTYYDYDRRITLSPHIFRLRPAPHCRTPILSYSLNIGPEEHFLNWQQDPFGNYMARVVFPEKTARLSVEVEVIAKMITINPFDFFLDEYAKEIPFEYDKQLNKELAPYRVVDEESPLLKKWLTGLDQSKRRSVDFLVDINTRMQADIGYNIRMEPGIQSCETTLKKQTGSCRDTAWLLVQALRRLGLAARFVSGYLVQLTPDVKSLDGPSGPSEDFTDLHAWTEVFLPGAGWVGLDPTSGLFAGEGHIPLACTPDPVSAAPVTGFSDKCETTFTFDNGVERIHEDPRVTKPYSDEQWRNIDSLGQRVDTVLAAEDVRLTMGGEPTFVSVDDMEGAEWTTDADGQHKRERAMDLLLRMRDRFAIGGALQYGQGKWYPGEELPRWRYACFWRPDGEPVWHDPQWMADPSKDYGHGPAQAERFMQRLAQELGGYEANVSPAYEDPVRHVWQESLLPENVNPLEYNLKDSLDRRRLAKILTQGLDEPVGYVLPLDWCGGDYPWISGKWSFRRERLYLIPGDSPMGLRLPLDGLHWIPPNQRPLRPYLDPFAPHPELPRFEAGPGMLGARGEDAASNAEPRPQSSTEPGPKPPPTPEQFLYQALGVEPRNGRLHVFMPPISLLDGYLTLVNIVERTAAALAMPVVLEGYPPPEDYRIAKFYVTPDPGVIEVNVKPSASWDELRDSTVALYEEAHNARLGTEKFLLDGRHTGTGGGNHVTLGGATPMESPLLRRPDLLGSLVTYWQHHPGLSYLFSGLFIGPTSQAPRVDEGRSENLYELEIALSNLPVGGTDQLWIGDRLMRNFLVDITGNTHRAEFCIDKLYSPDSPTGRLGILELRAFEMPPHARMSLVQMLLLRALVARFWREPYRKPLVRWGTSLHDKYLLHHYVKRDVQEVCQELQAAGLPFQAEWLDPFLEFRFPKYGEIRVGDIHLEIRQAIEPWHVLGEESTNTGTARYVDSSSERLEARLTGLTDSRYVLACNGRRMPLHNTGVAGEYVGSVRYKAWAPFSALHPTLGIDSPLTFDIVDTWNNRAIGGCTYHVVHPGGLSYDSFPVNAYEAEARRVSRFWDYGHSQGPAHRFTGPASGGRFVGEGSGVGPMDPPSWENASEYPTTLDLRRRRDA